MSEETEATEPTSVDTSEVSAEANQEPLTPSRLTARSIRSPWMSFKRVTSVSGLHP